MTAEPRGSWTAVFDAASAAGSVAHLITVGSDGSPRCSSVIVQVDEDRLVAYAGPHSYANAMATGRICLLWPAGPGEESSLILDGDASAAGEPAAGQIAITPTRAVYHPVVSTTGPKDGSCRELYRA
jgi:hypothetical protein